MKALLDTNIIIHRETPNVRNLSIGTLFKWLDKSKFVKCVHKVTVDELNKNSNIETRNSFNAKIQSYEILKMVAPLKPEVISISDKIDVTENDKNDTILLNEVYSDRVDILISEDKKIHFKAKCLGIEDKVFTIDSFLEMVVAEFPDLIDYRVLAVRQEYFGNINLSDPFFDSLKEDYPGFEKWFNKKAEEKAYITYNRGSVLSFLYLKTENVDENYSDINPIFKQKRRLKVGTFKVESNGVRLGERFMKIIFDNAVVNAVDEIYVTIFNRTEEQQRLISLMEDWGFIKYGTKGQSGELVYVRNFSKQFDVANPKKTFPFISINTNIFLIPIYPKYHTELLPDSYLRTESPDNFEENEPHRNAISKIYISRSVQRNIKKGDVLIFYRTAPRDKSAYYHSVITTIGIVEEKIDDIKSESDFIQKSRKRSIFTDDYLKEFWNFKPQYRPFLIRFLSTYSFPLGSRLNRKCLLDLGVIDGQENELRGLKKITREQFVTILKETKTNGSIIVN
ncbi:MAG: PIN domain-containing protein [Bacteroidales bacterium]